MIFLSYSWKDQGVAHQIEADLREIGFSVWIDYRELRPDYDILSQLDAAIFRCSVFAFVEGRNRGRSVWMKRELLIAQAYNKVVVRVAAEAPTVGLKIKEAWIGSFASLISPIQNATR